MKSAFNRKASAMFHLCAFFNASAGGLTDEDTPAVSDQVITISNNHFIPPVPAYIKMATLNGATAARLKISSPKLRALAQLQFPRATVATDNPTAGQINDCSPMPIKVNAIDELSALVTTTAGASSNIVGLWLDDGNTQHPRGEPYWIHGNSTFTSVAHTWTSGAIVFDQTLPAGKYSIIGMDVFAATTTFARLIFPTGGWRPGVLVRSAVGANLPEYFQNGYFGEFGQFASVAQPQLEVFSRVGVSQFDVFLQLLKLS
jgi:hypothetical protein